MRVHAAAVLLSLILFPLSGLAQDGLRSASLPERNLDRTPDTRDLFRATPENYAPGFDRSDRRRRPRHRQVPVFVAPWYPYFPGAAPYAYAYDGPAEAGHYGRPHGGPAEAGHYGRPHDGPAEAGHYGDDRHGRAPAWEPLPPNPPGEPKTFYVIPWCYAGDRPPQPDRLPARCDVADLQVIPPR